MLVVFAMSVNKLLSYGGAIPRPMDGLGSQRVIESFSQRAQQADDPNEPKTTQIKYD